MPLGNVVYRRDSGSKKWRRLWRCSSAPTRTITSTGKTVHYEKQQRKERCQSHHPALAGIYQSMKHQNDQEVVSLYGFQYFMPDAQHPALAAGIQALASPLARWRWRLYLWHQRLISRSPLYVTSCRLHLIAGIADVFRQVSRTGSRNEDG